jgi:hypothetical protein
MTRLTDDPGSLDRLHDIVVPPPAAWWPPAPAWYAVGAVTSGLIVVAGWRLAAGWRRNRYRRAALAELRRMPRDAGCVPGLARLLKRTALAAFPRERVAALTGEPWLRFLNATGLTDAFTRDPGMVFGDAEYRPGPAATVAEWPVLIDLARHWIANHRC